MSTYGVGTYGVATYGSGAAVISTYDPEDRRIKPLVPHFAIPFRIDGARGARVNEQDSENEILSCVETILRYEQGHRPEREEFGIPDLTFTEYTQTHPDERLIQAALNEWEPRIGMHAHDPIIDRIDQLVFRIRVEAHQRSE